MPTSKIQGNDVNLTAKDVDAASSSQLNGTFNNVDILEISLTLPRGIYYFTSSCTNLPTSDGRGYHVILSNRYENEDTPKIKLIAYDFNSEAVYYNTYESVWFGWTTHFLPLSGGKLNNSLYIEKETLPTLVLQTTANRGTSFIQNGTNNLIMASATDNELNTFYRLVVFNQNANVVEKLQLHRVDDGETIGNYKIFGTHNKPCGTYTGNGSATSRNIDLGVNPVGYSRCILITSSNGTALVTTSSGFDTNGTTLTSIPYAEAHIATTNLVLATTNTKLNANNISYFWQIL